MHLPKHVGRGEKKSCCAYEIGRNKAKWNFTTPCGQDCWAVWCSICFVWIFLLPGYTLTKTALRVYGNWAAHAHGFRSVLKHGAASPLPVMKMFGGRGKRDGDLSLGVGFLLDNWKVLVHHWPSVPLSVALLCLLFTTEGFTHVL